MKFIILSFLIFITQLGVSQNTLDYLGTLVINNNTAISFSLTLNEKNGIVNGYSITNIGLEDETKSEISGLYFKKDKSFQLYETQILSTRSEAPINTFCYINMNLSFQGKFGSKRLEGTFTGNFLDSIECAKGKVILIEKKKIEKKIAKVKKKIEKTIEKEILDTVQIIQTKTLKDDDNLTIIWKGNKLKLHIWDANKEDGDKIDLKINNDVILANFETKNKRKKIKYKLSEGENIIEITAINLGASPPNTSRIELIDNEIKYPLITQLKPGKSAIIKILK
mgnify:CR=1 FL=1|tara:strand:+ start:8338 stop:9180 length:843 start_codon:yes stop_codon:yes gene_type:complete